MCQSESFMNDGLLRERIVSGLIRKRFEAVLPETTPQLVTVERCGTETVKIPFRPLDLSN
jgi:hypothetical protein